MEFKNYDLDKYTEKEVLPKKKAFQKTVFPTICISSILLFGIILLYDFNIVGSTVKIIAASFCIIGFFCFLDVFPMFLKKLIIYRRSKNRLNSLPVITLTESGKVLYTNKYIKYTLSSIKMCEDDFSTKTLNITGNEGRSKRTIKISHYIMDLQLIKSIVDTFIAMENAKVFTNHTFETLLQLYGGDDPMNLYEEIKNIPFLLPIHYHLDTKVKTDYYHTLKNNSIISFPTLLIEEEVFIPLYSNANKVKEDSLYEESLLYNVKEIYKIIANYNEHTSDLFHANETIQGIIINPNTDHLVIRINTNI